MRSLLYLFLRSGATTSIVAVAIPISITATFGLLYVGRLTLNQMTVGGLATVLGLLPLALGWGEGAGLQAALARVVVGGLLASTLVTLFLIPTLASRQPSRPRASGPRCGGGGGALRQPPTRANATSTG